MYTKNTWANGDVITKTKLDHIEDGIYDNAVTQTSVAGNVVSFLNADGVTVYTMTLPN